MLKNKVALITGSNRGIGKSILTRFAEEGAVVYAAARNEGCLDAYSHELEEAYQTKIYPVYFDVRETEKAKKAIMRIKKEQGRLDVLVNNAGIMKDAVIGMISEQMMKDIFEVNVFAVINLIQLANKLMSRQKSGSIINLSSMVGVEGNAGQMAYAASKGAVAALTKAAAKELAPFNIRVNAIAPGMIDTDLFRSIGENKVEQYLKNIKMGRFGTPTDIANAAVFLASDLSTYITGQIIGVDGEAAI